MPTKLLKAVQIPGTTRVSRTSSLSLKHMTQRLMMDSFPFPASTGVPLIESEQARVRMEAGLLLHSVLGWDRLLPAPAPAAVTAAAPAPAPVAASTAVFPRAGFVDGQGTAAHVL